jgi:hypothetical protein
MLVPVVKKITENRRCFMERVFPVGGIWGVKEGDFVEPFNGLGDCRFSQNKFDLPEEFKPEDLKTPSKFYYVDTLLGKVKNEKIFAPYDGTLKEVEGGGFVFEENERKYVLLSGVWGNVKSFYENMSALIETQTKDILLAASTKFHTSGELVVFPNPSDVLKTSYLENFVKGIKGKIIYIGDYVGVDVVKRAYELEASALLAGSAHSEVFDFAKEHNFPIGVFCGFGRLKTPEEIYKFLSSVSYRYVFFEGESNLLRIPVKAEDLRPENEVAECDIFKNIEQGMTVKVLQDPHFGQTGVVDTVGESSIFVKFGVDNVVAEVRYPNFFILE